MPFMSQYPSTFSKLIRELVQVLCIAIPVDKFRIVIGCLCNRRVLADRGIDNNTYGVVMFS